MIIEVIPPPDLVPGPVEDNTDNRKYYPWMELTIDGKHLVDRGPT